MSSTNTSVTTLTLHWYCCVGFSEVIFSLGSGPFAQNTRIDLPSPIPPMSERS